MRSNLFSREALQFKVSKDSLRFSRLNWNLVFKPRVKSFFEQAILSCNEAGHLSFSIFESSNTENEGTLQLTAPKQYTGITDFIDEPNRKSPSSDIEKGASLVVSFTAVGTVLILITPYTSDRLNSNGKNIILKNNLRPEQLTKKITYQAFKRLFYLFAINKCFWLLLYERT
ncbi:hypothetical protein [Gilvimarinus polysaccharolyticus]|uniref:hypothetical protein n=1 Tax=Gilvimarinus polysaccharolyticus TaxID=863921 RepID=UPI0006737567|nr:hypothetical protein [Gilvimarinus polysaccharolyticus]